MVGDGEADGEDEAGDDDDGGLEGLGETSDPVSEVVVALVPSKRRQSNYSPF